MNRQCHGIIRFLGVFFAIIGIALAIISPVYGAVYAGALTLMALFIIAIMLISIKRNNFR